LPLKMDVSKMNMGDVITINTAKGEVTNEVGEVISTFGVKLFLLLKSSPILLLMSSVPVVGFL